jgi:hypothetical protein
VNSHGYDVVRLFRIAWPQMSEADREVARAEMRKMIDFCLAHLRPDGSFDMLDEDTLGSSFLFPVSLLNGLGYFRPSLRFWTDDEDFPDSMRVAERVEGRIRQMGLSDTESAKVLRRFEEARLERRVRGVAPWVLAAAALAVIAAAALIARRVRRRRRIKAATTASATAPPTPPPRA